MEALNRESWCVCCACCNMKLWLGHFQQVFGTSHNSCHNMGYDTGFGRIKAKEEVQEAVLMDGYISLFLKIHDVDIEAWGKSVRTLINFERKRAYGTWWSCKDFGESVSRQLWLRPMGGWLRQSFWERSCIDDQYPYEGSVRVLPWFIRKSYSCFAFFVSWFVLQFLSCKC